MSSTRPGVPTKMLAPLFRKEAKQSSTLVPPTSSNGLASSSSSANFDTTPKIWFASSLCGGGRGGVAGVAKAAAQHVIFVVVRHWESSCARSLELQRDTFYYPPYLIDTELWLSQDKHNFALRCVPGPVSGHFMNLSVKIQHKDTCVLRVCLYYDTYTWCRNQLLRVPCGMQSQ